MRSHMPAKHVKPALHSTRSILSVGLTAVLLPLCLASPALASPVATAGGSSAASPAAPAKARTTVRLSGPSGTVSPGSHAVGVRLLANGNAVKNGNVRLEKSTSSGWAYAGRLLTKSDGLATGRLAFQRTTKLRAVYQGSATRTAAASSPRTVTVAVASFRQQAVRVASQQKGKPYRYGATGPDSFDCSGLVKYSYARAGKSLPRTSQAMRGATKNVNQSAKQPGDLIFMQSNGRVSHVGVYAGNGQFWVAPKSGDVVKLQRIYASSYSVGRVA